MLDVLTKAAERVRAGRRDWSASALDGEAASAVVDAAAELERLVAAVRAEAALRVTETDQWLNEGARSPQDWLAGKTGSSSGQARRLLETSRQMEQHEAVKEAFEAGRLSEQEAAVITDACEADPAAAKRLLDTSARTNLTGLRREAERVKARSGEDELARYERIHRHRGLRTWEDRDGAGHIEGTVTKDKLALIRGVLQPIADRLFDQARQEGREEPADAYLADALVALCDQGYEAASGGKAPVQMNIVCTLDAWRTGVKQAHDRCEIAGLGEIPVAVARRYAQDAFFTSVLQDGVDILRVNHLGRHVPAELKTALLVAYPVCSVPGCESTWDLEADHNETDFADGGPLAWWNADRKCRRHHRMKTGHGFRLEGEPGDFDWVDPGGTIVASDDPRRVGRPARGVRRRPPDDLDDRDEHAA